MALEEGNLKVILQHFELILTSTLDDGIKINLLNAQYPENSCNLLQKAIALEDYHFIMGFIDLVINSTLSKNHKEELLISSEMNKIKEKLYEKFEEASPQQIKAYKEFLSDASNDSAENISGIEIRRFQM